VKTNGHNAACDIPAKERRVRIVIKNAIVLCFGSHIHFFKYISKLFYMLDCDKTIQINRYCEKKWLIAHHLSMEAMIFNKTISE